MKHNPLTSDQMVNNLLCRFHIFVNVIQMESVPHKHGNLLITYCVSCKTPQYNITHICCVDPDSHMPLSMFHFSYTLYFIYVREKTISSHICLAKQ